MTFTFDMVMNFLLPNPSLTHIPLCRKMTKRLFLSSSEGGGRVSIYFRRHMYLFRYMKSKFFLLIWSSVKRSEWHLQMLMLYILKRAILERTSSIHKWDWVEFFFFRKHPFVFLVQILSNYYHDQNGIPYIL